MKSELPSSASPKYGVELRASTPARSRRTSGMPARTRAATTAGPRGRLLGAPKTSSTRDPPSTPAPTASTMSSGPSCAAAARKNTATMTMNQPRRRHGRLIHGDPSTTVETMPAMKLESITPMEATSRSHSGRWTATSNSGVPKVSTMTLFRNDAIDCATRAARISIPKSRNRRRHSTTSPTAAGMSEATPWNSRYSARASASGRASKAPIVSRSNPTSVFDAPAAISRPRSTRSTPTMRWSTSDGVRTWRSAGGSSISVSAVATSGAAVLRLGQ